MSLQVYNVVIDQQETRVNLLPLIRQYLPEIERISLSHPLVVNSELILCSAEMMTDSACRHSVIACKYTEFNGDVSFLWAHEVNSVCQVTVGFFPHPPRHVVD